MARHYRCFYCFKEFTRADVLPPIGAVRPPGVPWRCRKCHAEQLRLKWRKLAVHERRQDNG